jgi:hypothetical protein
MNEIVTVKLVRETCWCGTPFMLTEELDRAARNHGYTIYCPLGHTIAWKETEETRLRRERDRLKQGQARLDEERIDALGRAAIAEVRADKAEAKAKKLTKRAASGTCPCCSRTFSNMSDHMKNQHPEFVQETGAKVILRKAAK